MLRRYFITAVRQIARYKMHSATTIIGFSISLSVVILLFLYVSTEMSADTYHKNYENIYRLNDNNGASLSPQYAEILSDNFPEIKSVTRVRSGGGIFKIDKPMRINKILYVDRSFLDIFTYDGTAGDLKTALDHPASIVLTEQEAIKYFGRDNPVGKTIQMRMPNHQWVALMVKAVLRDVSLNSSIQFSALIPLEFNRLYHIDNWDLTSANFQHYFLCYDHIDKNNLVLKIKELFSKHYPGWNLNHEYSIMPFDEIYFDHKVKDRNNHGNVLQCELLAAIGIVILILAMINFIILSIAKSTKRFLEIGMHKVLGADHATVIGYVLSEAIIISFIAVVIALTLTAYLIPPFNQLFNSAIVLPMDQVPIFILLSLTGAIVLGVIIGIYPASILTIQNVAHLIQVTKQGGRSGSSVVKGLLVFQFSVSVLLITCTLVISKQRMYIQNKNLGFDTDNILCVSGGGNNAFTQEIKQVPNIKDEALADFTPGVGSGIYGNTQWLYKGKEKEIYYWAQHVDARYHAMLNFKLLQGRFFNDELDNGKGACIINETARDQFEIDYYSQAWFDALGNDKSRVNVVGVIADFNHESLYKKVSPFIFFYNPNPEYASLLLKLKSRDIRSIQQTIQSLQDIWRKYYPDLPFDWRFLDDQIDALYKNEIRDEKIFFSFSIIAIIIACMGLFSLVSFTTEKRTKEIGIRKVLGATIPGIITLLFKDFTKWVLLANLFAWPIAWYATNKWLQNFAYRIDLTIWPFLLAGLITLTIALMTVSLQAVKAAIANPVEALRYE